MIDYVLSLGLQASVTGIIGYFLLDLRLNDAVAVAAIGVAGYVLSHWALRFLSRKYAANLKYTEFHGIHRGGGSGYNALQHDMTY